MVVTKMLAPLWTREGDVRRDHNSEHKHKERRDGRQVKAIRTMGYYRRMAKQKADEARRRAAEHIHLNTQSERPASARVVRRLAPRPRSISLSRGRNDMEDTGFPFDNKDSVLDTYTHGNPFQGTNNHVSVPVATTTVAVSSVDTAAILKKIQELTDKTKAMEVEMNDKIAIAAKQGYAQGRAEAENIEAQWINSASPTIVDKAKRLIFISIREFLKAMYSATTIKKKSVKVGTSQDSLRLVFDDEIEQENQPFGWPFFLEFQIWMMKTYTKDGGQDKLHTVFMPHTQILTRLGNARKYSYQSIYRFDEHVRSRESGQGPNLSWSFDHATSHIFLEPFVAKDTSAKERSSGKSTATELFCHKWEKKE